MFVKITWNALRRTNVGRYLFYEVAAGNVVRALNAMNTGGSSILFQIEPPVGISTFLERFPAAIEVIEMADGSFTNPNIITDPTPNKATFTVQVVNIPTAGTPVQLPALAVPNGFSVLVGSELSNSNNQRVYVSDSSANALLTTARATLAPGNTVRLFVDDVSDVWVNASANNQKVFFIVDQ